MALQDEVIETYRDLMAYLATLPAEIEIAKEGVLKVRLQLAEFEAAMKGIEDAYTPEGSNDTARKADKANYLAKHAVYQRFSAAAKRGRSDLAQIEIGAEKLDKQFIAVGFAARLHAGLMAYLAAAGCNAPPVDIAFGMGKPVNGSNGHVTLQDAAEIGL